MERIFLRLVPMSLTAGWLVLAVLLLRLMLKKAPRRIVCLLWLLVALRLLCPMQIAWRASLVPPRETVERAAQTTLAQQPNEARPAEAAVTAPSAALRGTQILSCVWLAGMTGMLLWLAVSDLRLRRRLRSAVRGEANIRRCSGIDTPFVLGVFRPRIYLPPELDPAQTEYVLAHERAHIARGDHLWKLLGWLLLSVYWFHPLLWAAYVLMCRDLELACDERVARGLDRAGRASYAEALLDCGCRRHRAPVRPVAFGEVRVRERVKAVLRYQKPAFLRVALAVLAVAAAGVFFLTEQPANALQLAQTPPAAEEPAVETGKRAFTDALPPDPKQSEPPQAPSASTQTQAAANQSAYGSVSDASETYGNSQFQIDRPGYDDGTADFPQQVIDSQNAYNERISDTYPQPLVPAADRSGNPNARLSNIGETWNGGVPVIQIFP